MKNNIPEFLYNKLVNDYGESLTNKIIEGYNKKRLLTLRVNSIKSNIKEIKEVLDKLNIKYESVSWYEDALVINGDIKDITELDIYKNGLVYVQSLSSMLPPLVLKPMTNENRLDMTAAPGSKTTQIAALSNNTALITAVEKNKIRIERLKYNIDKLGAKRISIIPKDARNLDDYFSFDKILLDAPCSGSGTVLVFDNSINNITEELITRSVSTQYELLEKAIKVLKPNHELVYSTCSILKEENEKNVKKIMDKYNLEIIPIDVNKYEGIELLPVSIDGTICVCPNEYYEGFFVAKLKKKDII